VIKLTASLGVSSLRGNDTVDSFVQRADDAMYQAKEMGRNRVQAAA
jgi:diguanylate cyclase (GGDEF)-like protein